MPDHHLVVINVSLPHEDSKLASRLWRVKCQGGRVTNIGLMSEDVEVMSTHYSEIDAKGSIMLPS
jgi:hypothetical protein